MSAQWAYPFCYWLFKVNLRIFAKVKIEGRENMPPEGPLIVVCNHLSNVDPAIAGVAMRRRPGFLAKSDLFKFPPLAFFLYGYGAFPIERGKADTRALKWAARRIEKGGAVVLFPEGTRSRGQGLLKAQPGVALLASMTRAPVVPIAITGSEPLQNYLKVFAPVSKLHIRIGKPFTLKTGGKASREQLDRFTVEAMSRLARLLPPEYRGEYADTMDMPLEVTSDTVPA